MYRCKTDVEDMMNRDLSELIKGEWKFDDSNCLTGFIFEENGIFKNRDFISCSIDYSNIQINGTYSIAGKTLLVVTGLGNFETEITIDGNQLILSEYAGDENVVLSKFEC